jgi:7,8-dihydro-6-hydroxymethylpterin dimethyltransferase
MIFLTPEQIAARRPLGVPHDASAPLQRTRTQLQLAGLWHPTQQMGQRWAMGCVALEVTQRCNLDCTLCYLSESAEAIKDIPLEEVFRRIDMIRERYGPNTDVQVTGGDPTLRPRDELIAIVRRIRECGLRPSLFTNGILASRELLTALAQAGLVDVAFHVDMTQQRKGYASETELNALRLEYIERTQGLGLSVLFNTTVFDGNFHEIPAVARFFVAHSRSVRFVSFQLQADTGRGVLHQRGYAITTASTIAQLQAGIGADLNFDAASAGHSACNRFGIALVANGKAYDAMDDADFVKGFVHHTADLAFDRNSQRRVIQTVLARMLRRPGFMLQSLQWAAHQAWRMKTDLWHARGRVQKLTFFVHNFMDAQHLEADRIDACAFMIATHEGPMSMCLHNAERDRYVLKALPMTIAGVPKYWNPLTGKLEAREPKIAAVQHTRKTARGRVKQALEREAVESVAP